MVPYMDTEEKLQLYWKKAYGIGTNLQIKTKFKVKQNIT